MVDLSRIDSQIKTKGWSRSEFLRRLELSTSAFGDWKAGKASPDKHLPKIAALLDTTEAYLRGETDNPAPIYEARYDMQQTLDASFTLTTVEHDMLTNFRSLPPDKQEQAINVIKAL